MKSRRFSLAFAFAVSLSLVIAFVLSSLMKKGTAAPAPPENSPFKGKVVVVQMHDRYSVALGDAQVRQLGGRSFLVGKGSDEGNPTNWTKSRINWVPLDRITQLVEFESEAEMKKAWEEYQKVSPVPPHASRHGPPERAGSELPPKE